MSNRFWFRPKRYGYGFVPTSWEGWLMTGIFIGVLALVAWRHDFFEPGYLPRARDGFAFLWDLVVATAIFSLIAVRKTDGELKWNWGGEVKSAPTSIVPPVAIAAAPKKVVVKPKKAVAKTRSKKK